MARLRKVGPAPVSPSGVPEALQDHNSDVWYDARLYQSWCLTHLGKAPGSRGSQTAYWRFGAALTAWAKANGFMQERLPTHVDYERLKPLGITQIRTLERCQMRDSSIRYTWSAS
jgi:hypothetical protein